MEVYPTNTTVGTYPKKTANGTYTRYVTVTSATPNDILYIQADASFVGSVDNITVKEVGQGFTFGGEAEFNNGLVHFESNTNTYSYIRQDISSLTTKYYKKKGEGKK